MGGSDYKGFEEIDLVIEAVPEDVTVKKRVFQENRSSLQARGYFCQ